jgi:translation initiation factor 3 subunit G
MRGPGGTRTAGPPGGGSRDDLPTLRVTNISEDTQESDLRELFGLFGRVARVYVGRDRETGAGKGFAFVSFEERAVAQKAMEKVNGKGYDNLILSVQWSCEFFLSPKECGTFSEWRPLAASTYAWHCHLLGIADFACHSCCILSLSYSTT